MATLDGPPEVAGQDAGPSAAARARSGQAPRRPDHDRKFVCFRLRGQEFALPIEGVEETLAVPPITPVFLTPPCFAGIVNLRGDIVAVLDLAWLLGLDSTPITPKTRVVMCRAGDPTDRATADAGEAIRAGLLVDELADLRTLDPRRIEPPPATLPERSAALLAGVTMTESQAPLQVLDVARLFACDEVRGFQREASA